MPIPFVLGLVPPLACPIPWASDQNGPVDKKQLETQAKQLIAEGKALEQQGKLAEALDKCIDAEGVFSSEEGLASVLRTRAAENQKVSALVAATRATFEAAKYEDCTAQLEEALKIEPAKPLVHYDLAACYSRLGDRPRSIDHLDLSLSATIRAKWRAEQLELRSELMMGTASSGPMPGAPPQAAKRLETFNEAYLAAGHDPGDPVGDRKPGTASGQNLCGMAGDLAHDFPADAVADFDQAKCAEEDGRPQEAAKLLGEYLELALNAMDQADAKARREQLTSLAALPGDLGRNVRQHYALAARYLDYACYDHAIAE